MYDLESMIESLVAKDEPGLPEFLAIDELYCGTRHNEIDAPAEVRIWAEQVWGLWMLDTEANAWVRDAKQEALQPRQWEARQEMKREFKRRMQEFLDRRTGQCGSS